MTKYINVYEGGERGQYGKRGAKGAAFEDHAAAAAASRLHARHGKATLYRLRVKPKPGCYLTAFGKLYRGHL